MNFQAWLKKNQQHFRGYSPDEVARVAYYCGFKIPEVCGPIGDHVMHLKRLFSFWGSPLAEKWMHVANYERGFDEY